MAAMTRRMRRSLVRYFSLQCYPDASYFSITKFIAMLGILFFLLNYLGLLDLTFEQGYHRFQWPFDHVDVARQVLLLQTGMQLEYAPVYTHDVGFLATPSAACSGEKLPLILILVKSRPKRENQRQSVRQWWKEHVQFARTNGKYAIEMYFLTGTSSNETIRLGIEAETKSYGDLIHCDFTDDGDRANERLAIKSAWIWTYEKCNNSPTYLLIVSDQYQVSLQNLVKLADQMDNGTALYSGYLHEKVKVPRHKFGSKSLALSDYPFTHFPPFIDSSFILLSKKSVELFYYGSQYIKPFQFGDVYVGMVAKSLRITAQHNDLVVPSSRASERGYFGCSMFAHSCLDLSALIAWPVMDSVSDSFMVA